MKPARLDPRLYSPVPPLIASSPAAPRSVDEPHIQHTRPHTLIIRKGQGRPRFQGVLPAGLGCGMVRRSDRRETERLLEAIRQARAGDQPAAVATVVRVKGSAYRREGTQDVRPSGRDLRVCAVGRVPGADGRRSRGARHRHGEPVIVTYDLADDSVWGLGIGCSGAVDIRIERVEDDAITNLWLAVLERERGRGARHAALRRIRADDRVRLGDVVGGGLSDPAVEQAAIDRARALPRRARTPQSGPEQVGGCRALIRGGDSAARRSSCSAQDTTRRRLRGWPGRSGSGHGRRCARRVPDPERFGGATWSVAHFSEFAERVTLGPGTFALIMNHHVERDQESLRFSARVGRGLHRRARAAIALRDALRRPRARGLRARRRRPRRVRSPVGLSLGAETPRGSRGVRSWRRFWRFAAASRAASCQGSGGEPSPTGRQTALGELVILGRVDIDQQVRRELRTRVRSRWRSSTSRAPCWQRGEFGEELALRTGAAAPSPRRTGR